jgi:predicted dehydrogenase
MNIALLSTAHIHTNDFLKKITTATDGRKVHAIWDDVTERGQDYAAKYNAPFQPDLEALLADPAVDGFIICAENTRHPPLLEKVLPLGKPVFCEKPLATTVAEVQRVRALQAEHATPLFCGYFQPFFGHNRSVRQILADGGLGRVTRVKFRNAHHAAYGRWFDSPALAWFTQPELSGGGALMDMGTHAVHLLVSLFGKVESVWAHVANHAGVYPAVDDYGIAHLRFRDGTLGQVEASWSHTGGSNGLEIIGSEAAIMENTARNLVIVRPGKEPEPIPAADARPDRVDRLVAIHRGEISQPELDADLEACIHAVEIMSAAYESAKLGTWVTLPK